MQFLNLRSSAFIYSGLLAVVTLANSCKSTEALNAAAPEKQAVISKPYVRPVSSISIPVSFQIKGLEERLNQEVKGVLYNDESLEGDDVAVRVAKAGNITVQANNDKLYFTLPLDIYAKGRFQWKACDFCPNISKTEDTKFGITLKFESALALTEDYGVKSSTISDFEWGQKPVVSLGPLNISLARFVEPALKDQMKNLSAQLDKELSKRINIKEQVRTAWVQMQQPIQLDKTYNAWLRIEPQEIRVSPLQARNNEVSLRIGINSFIETVTDGKPNVTVNRNLPPLVTDRNLKDDVQIGLTGEISYEHATRLMKDQIVGKTFTFEGGKQQLTVNAAELSGTGEKLLLMMDVKGFAKSGFIKKNILGKVYLKAIPYFDAATSTVRLRDVEFDLNTKDMLLKTAGWLANGRFRENIQNQVSFPMKTQLADAKKMLQQSLDKQGKLNPYLTLKGTVTDISPEGIYLTPNSIKAVVNATGNLQLRLEKL